MYVSWHTIIRDIGKSSSREMITNSESQIIRENTFIVNFFLIDDYFSFLQYFIMFSLIVYIKVLIKILKLIFNTINTF
jgi:hypothetical protein